MNLWNYALFAPLIFLRKKDKVQKQMLTCTYTPTTYASTLYLVNILVSMCVIDLNIDQDGTHVFQAVVWIIKLKVPYISEI